MMPDGDSESTPHLIGLTTLWEPLESVDMMRVLGAAMLGGEIPGSTSYPIFLAVCKALLYRWACQRRQNPNAPQPPSLYLALQHKANARRARIVQGRARNEVAIEDLESQSRWFTAADVSMYNTRTRVPRRSRWHDSFRERVHADMTKISA